MEFWLSLLCFVARRFVHRIEQDLDSFSVYIGGTDWVLELRRTPRHRRKVPGLRRPRIKDRLSTGTVVPFPPLEAYEDGRQLEPGNDDASSRGEGAASPFA